MRTGLTRTIASGAGLGLTGAADPLVAWTQPGPGISGRAAHVVAYVDNLQTGVTSHFLVGGPSTSLWNFKPAGRSIVLETRGPDHVCSLSVLSLEGRQEGGSWSDASASAASPSPRTPRTSSGAWGPSTIGGCGGSHSTAGHSGACAAPLAPGRPVPDAQRWRHGVDDRKRRGGDRDCRSRQLRATLVMASDRQRAHDSQAQSAAAGGGGAS